MAPRAGSLLAGAHLLLALLFPLSGVALFYAPRVGRVWEGRPNAWVCSALGPVAHSTP